MSAPSWMRHLSIAGCLAVAFLLTIFIFPVWATATCGFAILVVVGTSLLLRRIDETD
jgi:hypothetical protein